MKCPQKAAEDAEQCEQCTLPTKPNANRCYCCKTYHLIKKQPTWVNFKGRCMWHEHLSQHQGHRRKKQKMGSLKFDKNFKINSMKPTKPFWSFRESRNLWGEFTNHRVKNWSNESNTNLLVWAKSFGNTEIPKWCEKMLFPLFSKCKFSTSGLVQTFQPI